MAGDSWDNWTPTQKLDWLHDAVVNIIAKHNQLSDKVARIGVKVTEDAAALEALAKDIKARLPRQS